MSVPPDDMPRSPSGRVPQWVHDEVAGRSPTQTTWRTDQLPSSARTRRPRHRARSFLVVVVLTVTIGAGWVAYKHDPELGTAIAASLSSAPVAGRPLPVAPDPNRPSVGVEEAAKPLAVAPNVSVPSTSYAFLGTQKSGDGVTVPIAWSPCRPIHFVTNVTGAPEGFADNVRVAVQDVSAATGLVFVDDGATTEAPAAGRASYLPDQYGDRWAPVLIEFADATTIVDLAAAVGLTSTQPVQDPTTGKSHFVSGVIYLATRLLVEPAQGSTPAYVPVLRHELGHLVGLGHINDPTQVMYPLTSQALPYQAGDLTGLAALGHDTCAPGL